MTLGTRWGLSRDALRVGWRLPRTVRGRLLVLLLLSAVPETWLSFNDAIEERRLALADLQHEARRFVEFASLQQREIVRAAGQLLKSMAGEPQIAAPASAPACGAALARLLKIHPQYLNLHVLRTDGTLVCSALPPTRKFDAAAEGYLREALTTGRFTVSDYELSQTRGVGEVVFAQPVTGPSGRVERVITAALDLSWLRGLRAQARLPQGSVLSVVDHNGVLLARDPDPGRWGGISIYRDYPGLERLIAAARPFDIELVSLDGVRRAFAFEPVRGARSAIYVGVGIPVEAAHERAQTLFVRKLLLSGAGALLVFALAWWGMRRFVLRPLEMLSSTAGRLERGEWSARTGWIGDGGEFGQLAQAFDRMAEGIETRERRIEGAATDLARANRALKTLSASNRALVHAQDLQGLMDDICRAAVDPGGYRMAWVGWAESGPDKAVRARAFAGHEEGFLAIVNATWGDSERGRGTSGEAIRSGHTNVINDALAEPRLAPWREEFETRGYLSVISLPVRTDGRIAGALTIYGGEKDAFTAEAIRLLEELAEDLSYGLSILELRERERHASESLRELAYRDASTGLPNRTALRDRLEQEISAARDSNRSLAVVLLSIDNYREIANTLGVRASESLLVKLAARFQLVAEGTLARAQSAEFGLLLPHSAAERALAAARGLLATMEEPIEVSGSALYVHGSAGIAFYPGHAGEASTLLRHADAALEHAQRTGGHAVYEPAMDQGAPERIAMAAELKHAIEGEELIVYCQPKLDLGTRRIIGAEALVRWRHPTTGLVSPAAFIPLAERTGLIKPLTYWVIGAACRQVRAWREAGIALPLAVNLSVRNLRDPQLLDTVAGLFATWGIKRGEIEIELTESMLMEDPAGAQETISRLHAMGIPLYIDDFGTGYSSLAYLERLPVDSIKIDQSFVAGMAKSDGARKIVRSTIELAHNLGMKVVAEGIETADALERLAVLGCDGAQGYHIARPMPAEEIPGWLAGSPWR